MVDATDEPRIPARDSDPIPDRLFVQILRTDLAILIDEANLRSPVVTEVFRERVEVAERLSTLIRTVGARLNALNIIAFCAPDPNRLLTLITTPANWGLKLRLEWRTAKRLMRELELVANPEYENAILRLCEALSFTVNNRMDEDELYEIVRRETTASRIAYLQNLDTVDRAHRWPKRGKTLLLAELFEEAKEEAKGKLPWRSYRSLIPEVKEKLDLLGTIRAQAAKDYLEMKIADNPDHEVQSIFINDWIKELRRRRSKPLRQSGSSA